MGRKKIGSTHHFISSSKIVQVQSAYDHSLIPKYSLRTLRRKALNDLIRTDREALGVKPPGTLQPNSSQQRKQSITRVLFCYASYGQLAWLYDNLYYQQCLHENRNFTRDPKFAWHMLSWHALSVLLYIRYNISGVHCGKPVSR